MLTFPAQNMANDNAAVFILIEAPRLLFFDTSLEQASIGDRLLLGTGLLFFRLTEYQKISGKIYNFLVAFSGDIDK